MPRLLIPREVLRRLKGHDGLLKATAEFAKCCEDGTQPPRVYKSSGIARDGEIFQPYMRLKLYHHHLHRSGEPILAVQHVGTDVRGVGVTTHAAYFGDKMLWLQEYEHLIDWESCDDIREAVLAYRPKP